MAEKGFREMEELLGILNTSRGGISDLVVSTSSFVRLRFEGGPKVLSTFCCSPIKGVRNGCLDMLMECLVPSSHQKLTALHTGRERFAGRFERLALVARTWLRCSSCEQNRCCFQETALREQPSEYSVLHTRY